MANEIFGRVDQGYIDRVEKYNNRKFENVGTFDYVYLKDFVDLLGGEVFEEIELLVMRSALADGSDAGLLVVKSGDEYFALAGIRCCIPG